MFLLVSSPLCSIGQRGGAIFFFSLWVVVVDVGFSVVVVFLSLIMWKWGKVGGASSGAATVKTVYMWKATWPPHAGWPSRLTSWTSHCGGAAGLLGRDVLGTGVYRSVVPILHAWLFHRPVHWSHCGGTLWVVTARKVKECFKWRRRDGEIPVGVLRRTQVLLKHIFLTFCRKWRMFLNIFACWCTYLRTSPQTG